MSIGTAVAKRIEELCVERGITLNKLATISGITQSTLNNIISGASKSPTISTIKKVSDGLEITVVAFFDAPIFRELEQELE